MARSYYYFTATLPGLTFPGSIPQPLTRFLGDAQRLLDLKDYQCLKALTEGRAVLSGNPAASKWSAFDRALRNEWAWQVSEARGANPFDHLRGGRPDDPFIREIVTRARLAPDPLSGEKIIDTSRWRFLEDLAVNKGFSFDSILVYGLKLKILERYHHVEMPSGKAIVDRIENVDEFLAGRLQFSGI